MRGCRQRWRRESPRSVNEARLSDLRARAHTELLDAFAEGRMEIPLFQVDAFSDRVFGGNPAAVCPLQSWLSDEILQSIALENNLSETAFFVPEGRDFRLRWFTPKAEVALCGHATLATAFVLFDCLKLREEPITFHSLSGPLTVSSRSEGGITLDFPESVSEKRELTPALREMFGSSLQEAHQAGGDLFLFFREEADVRDFRGDSLLLKPLSSRGVVLSALGNTNDFVSRAFFPNLGIEEDPVTGSTHCFLAPYWGRKLQKYSLSAEQLSSRRGKLFCEIEERFSEKSRVKISGHAALYLQGTISIAILENNGTKCRCFRGLL